MHEGEWCDFSYDEKCLKVKKFLEENKCYVFDDDIVRITAQIEASYLYYTTPIPF